MGLISVTGASLKTRLAERSDPTSSALRHIIAREVESEKNYNAPHFRGSTNPQQTLAAGDHTHGTPDGTINLLAANIVASVRNAQTPIYIPDGWECEPGLIRGSLTKWRLSCYPPGAVLSFRIDFPGFIDGRRIIMPYTLNIPFATDGMTGDIAGGEVRSSADYDLIGITMGQNTTDDTVCHVEVTLNGSTNGSARAQGCTLNLHGHRNRTYSLILLPQLDPSNPPDEDLPQE